MQTRRLVLAVLGGGLDVRPTPRQAIQRNPISGRVEGRGHEGFHAMRQGVHAGGRRHERGQAQREFGVEDGGFGHQMPRMKTQLATIVDDDDGAACHLAASACRGGHGNQGQRFVGDAPRAAFDGGVSGEWPRVGGGNRHAFGAIDGRAAAQSNQAIASGRLAQRRGGTHRGFGGVGGRGVKHRAMQTGQGVQGFLQQTSGLDACVGHDQRLGDAVFLAFFGQEFQGAKFNVDLGEVNETGHGEKAKQAL